MKIKIDQTVILRTPVFPVNAELTDHFNKLRALIREASESFEQLISTEELPDLVVKNSKAYYSLWKYFNRSKYRATPFGRFAGISTLQLSTQANLTGKIILENELNGISLRDWRDREGLPPDRSFKLKNATLIQKNATVYGIGNKCRFLVLLNQIYELHSVDRFAELDFILSCTTLPVHKDILIEKVIAEFQISKASVNRLLENLLEIQMIWSDKMINVTGDDYFIRNDLGTGSSKKYFLSERNVIKADYHEPLSSELEELVVFLNETMPYGENADLLSFKKDFLKKYDRRLIPLCDALDPLIGLGYAGLNGQSETSLSVVAKIFSASPKKEKPENIVHSPFLKGLIQEISKSKSEVKLEQFEFPKLDLVPVLPNSFSVKYRKYRNNLVVQHIGGITANALIGRFTMTNAAIEETARRIANIEISANPGVIFFDVSYQAEMDVDNVNRRKQIYGYELPLSGFTSGVETLSCDDIYVGVAEGEIILYSKRMNRRIIPRIPTAYNFKRSNLSIYRFLSDIQGQSLRTSLNIQVRSLIPDLDYYCRISYKNIILSPRSWKVPEYVLEAAACSSYHQIEPLIGSWLNTITDNNIFSAGEGDRSLIFDKRISEDIQMLARFILQEKDKYPYLSEALIDVESGAMNESGEPLAAEYILSLINTKKIYSNIRFGERYFPGITAKRNFYPCDEWVYFEIFVHPAYSNTLLTEPFKAFLDTHRTLIKKWFFIRYEEGGHHLRLRLELIDSKDSYIVISGLNSALKEDSMSGLISDLSIKTYVRELERYGENNIESVEELFHADSKIVLTILNRHKTLHFLYSSALNFMKLVIKVSFGESEKAFMFVNQLAEDFSMEFDLRGKNFKILNTEYEAQRNQQEIEFPVIQKSQRSFAARMGNLFNDIVAINKIRLTADIIHMHINRLFPDDQRKHEAILYQFLLKDMKRSRHCLKRLSQSQSSSEN